MLIKIFNPFFLFLIAVATVLQFFKLNTMFNYFYITNTFKYESSVWCTKSSSGSNLCKFKNICYDPDNKAFLFFLSKLSVVKGLTHHSDMQKIQLSSIKHHNQFYANMSIIDIENFKFEAPVKIKTKSSLLFSRFKPDNIMHVIHDDLLPIFLTMQMLCYEDFNCLEENDLVIHDTHPEGPFIDLYKLFSKDEPIFLSRLTEIICFKEIITGLVQDAVFYQYGFQKPHGPVKNPYLNINDIILFTSYIKQKLISHTDLKLQADIILISRQQNRKILNAPELKEMIRTAYQKVTLKNKVKILVLDLNSNRTTTFIKAVSQAHCLVGMHGAEMIFSLFMKPNSIIVELFPYGIQPEVVSFLKPILSLQESKLFYFAWRNMNKSNSRANPDAHPLFGGIKHLDKEMQATIKSITEVPPVKCCNNPVYLYHMYQDTSVPKEFKIFFQQSVAKYLKLKNGVNSAYTVKKWFYPYIATNISCKFQPDKRILEISWHPPFNVKEKNKLKYSLYVMNQDNEFRQEFLTQELSLDIKIPVQFNTQFQAWLSVYYDINNSKSPDIYFVCD